MGLLIVFVFLIECADMKFSILFRSKEAMRKRVLFSTFFFFFFQNWIFSIAGIGKFCQNVLALFHITGLCGG